MGTINDRNGKDLTEAEEIKKRWQVYTEELYKNGFNDPDNHDVWIMEDGVRHPGKILGILQARILEWVAIPFSRGSSQPRDQTQASCIAGRLFTS